MHLALAPRRRLAALYGRAAPELLAALDGALAAREAAGVSGRAYDPEEGLSDLDIGPAALEPAPLAAQLRAVSKALAAHGTIVESLWIIGGPQVVPFGSLPNPVPDSDGAICTDSVYGLADSYELICRWPVGRTPDADPPEPGLLASLLRRVADAHRASPPSSGPLIALSAASWAAVTETVLTDAGVAVPCRLTPPESGAAGLEGARTIYCNLHGVRNADAWYGHSADGDDLVVALRPDDLAGLRMEGAAVISQACFGARLASAAGLRSMAVALLAAGADALVAAHGLTYGATEPPPGESDLLAQAWIAALAAPGVRTGDLLLSVTAGLLREILLRRGAPDADDVKTLLGFNLYGDPALRR